MNYRPQHRPSILAFTLIELLVVITIIAILMGLLFPAINIVKEQARKAEAKAAVTQIAAAVKQYYNEYGKYPQGDVSTTGSDDLVFGEGFNSNELLFNILRCVKLETYQSNPNPRRIVFFEGKAASNPESPRSGFVATDASKGTPNSFVDPWGKQYVVVVDANYDNQIKDSLPHSDFKGDDKGPRTGVAVYSLGKDGAVGSPKEGVNNKFRDGSKISDDIISWQ
jgi:prepilin-type N-terminal cleavage/methylation domain-containing protein